MKIKKIKEKWSKLKIEYKGFWIGFFLSLVILLSPFVINFPTGHPIELGISIAWIPLCYILPSGGHPNPCGITFFLMPFVYGYVGSLIAKIIKKRK